MDRHLVTRLVGAAALLAGLARAHAGEEHPGEPAPTRVQATLDGSTAHVSARFVVHVRPGRDTASLTIQLPAHSLVTAGTVTVDGKRHPLALTSADTADTDFTAAMDRAGGRDRAWVAKLSTQPGNGVALQMAAPRKATVTLDLELDAPTCFVNDARHVAIPSSWEGALDARLRRTETAGSSELEASCGEQQGPSFAIAAPSLAKGTTIDTRIGAAADRLSVSKDVHFTRAELALTSKLGRIPGDLRTAIVVDASRSLSPDELRVQRATVVAYLAVAPRGSVQVISYARTATPLLKAWMPASEAATQIDRALKAMTPRNGSNLDAGLAEALAWLGKTKGSHRILLFSDERLPHRITNALASLGGKIPAGTILHSIVLDGGQGTLERFDEAQLAPLAAATTGIAVSSGLDDKGHVDATILARPISLDHVTMRTPGWHALEHAPRTCLDDASMPEGTSCIWWGEGSASSGDLTFEGRAWNRVVSRTVHPDSSRSLSLARHLSALGILPDELDHEIDLLARAVNGTWSLYGTWGGKAGYADLPGGGGSGWGTTCDCAAPGTIGHGSGTGSGRRSNFPEELRGALADAVAGCHPDSARVGLTVETTLQEIVDVGVTVMPAAPAVRDCIVEAVWRVPLAVKDAPEHATTELAYMN
jgi:Mg-chelatase subunit ChlD